MDINIEVLDKSHCRDNFDCGIDELSTFLKKYARQHQRNNISKTFVAVPKNAKGNVSKEVLGYYTLSSGQIDQSQLPVEKKHPRHPVSIARLARLAVDLKHQGDGVGGDLLYDALNKVKAASDMIGIYAVIVDAKDNSAKSFYEHYGFIELQNPDLTLFLPMKTINKLFS